ncbi:MAG TPA: hypothetical protein VKS44_15450 [Candidatus Acidoferrales bacterium]|nr:hypothetical protein [Candidatus Acidoferrales bacterium]
MERREVVNASNENTQPDEWGFDASNPSSIAQASTSQFPGDQFPARQSTSRPLCLYLGPGGERCYQQALDNGFCARHQPNRSPTALPDEGRARTKKAAATVGILAALWPLIEELLRQIFRLLR